MREACYLECRNTELAKKADRTCQTDTSKMLANKLLTDNNFIKMSEILFGQYTVVFANAAIEIWRT